MATTGDSKGRSRPSKSLNNVQATVTDWETQARTFVQQRPVAAVLAALGAGYLIARLASR